MNKTTNTRNIFYVYGLIDPVTCELRYIGETWNVKQRLSSHLKPSNLKSHNHKCNWLKSLRNNKLKPKIIIIETYSSEDEALTAEVDLIAYFKFIGCDLTNGTSGGDKGKIMSEEAKRKLSEANKGKISPNKGIKLSEEMKNQISKTKKSQNLVGEKASNAKLNWQKVEEIRNLYQTEKLSTSELAIKFNVGDYAIACILNNVTWINKTYIPNMRTPGETMTGRIMPEETKNKLRDSVAFSKRNILDTESHKQCRNKNCLQIKLRNEFHKNKLSYDGLMGMCKKCNCEHANKKVK